MSDISYREISLNGLWKNNPAIVQLLGLCPLLAVTGSVINALGMGIATMLVLTVSNTCVSMIRSFASDAIRLPAFVMIIAAAVTCIELLMQAFAYALITTNCVILGRADAFACKNKVLPSMYDGFIMGAGFAVILMLLGAIREVVGTGAIFANMDLLFGEGAKSWKIVLVDDYTAVLVAILPPGAFIFTGMIIALKNIIDTGIKNREAAKTEKAAPTSRRVRVTGNIS
jgi:electron transport complex protein RnfE